LLGFVFVEFVVSNSNQATACAQLEYLRICGIRGIKFRFTRISAPSALSLFLLEIETHHPSSSLQATQRGNAINKQRHTHQGYRTV
jgi:hypothetical protein